LSPSLDHKGDKTLDEASFFALVCLLSNNGRGQPTIGRNGIFPVPVPNFSKCSSTAQSRWSLYEVYGMQTSLCTVLNWTIVTYVYHLYPATERCLKQCPKTLEIQPLQPKLLHHGYPQSIALSALHLEHSFCWQFFLVPCKRFFGQDLARSAHAASCPSKKGWWTHLQSRCRPPWRRTYIGAHFERKACPKFV
jgi:hypothetical protein